MIHGLISLDRGELEQSGRDADDSGDGGNYG